MSVPDTTLLRVERGLAGPEELAAVTAVLLARAATLTAEVTDVTDEDNPAAGWRRLERQIGFPTAHSWRN
ncbi:acyl-CoA carboxylase subunit epsilon [Streptomyces laurentii]|uniref:acyl-CoA carboxylase subunit epsilon n=1 Tax=Streptomyces laurentii TaxID=39478 RepID=UPI00369FE583